MIRFFLKNLFINSLLFIPLIVILSIKNIISHPNYTSLDQSFFLSTIFNANSWWPTGLGIALIYIQAILIIQLVNESRLNNKNSAIAGLFYVVGICMIPSPYMIHPILIANTFIILFFKNLIKIYKTYKPSVHIFMSGFHIGVATILMPYNVILVIFLILSLLQLREISFREVMQSIMGFLCPIFLFTLVGFYFLQTEFFDSYSLALSSFSFDEISYFKYINLGILCFLLLFIIVSQNKIRKKRSVKSQKILRLLYLLMFFSLFMLIFNSAQDLFYLSVLIFPLSILYSMYIFTKKKILFPELILFVFLVVIIAVQFLN